MSGGADPAEYQAVRSAAGISERADLAVLRMSGRDPVRMLQGLITNDLAGAPAGQGVYAAILTPKGRMVADLRAFQRDAADGVEVLILLPRTALDGTKEHLRKYVPPMFARWEVSDDDGNGTAMAVVGVYGPASRQLIGEVLDQEIPDLGLEGSVEGEFGGERVLLTRTDYAGGEQGYDLIAPASAARSLITKLRESGGGQGVRAVGEATLETLRIEQGVPVYGRELTEDTIPTEAYESTGMLSRAISFTKGCYTGQEVIIRIAHRGHVNRHLRGLRLGDAAAPAFRTPLFHPESGKEIGWTTSTAVSPRMGGPVSLGYVRRELGPGDTVKVGGPDGDEAEVTGLPFV
jgi:folate-binding protein YgfZ